VAARLDLHADVGRCTGDTDAELEAATRNLMHIGSILRELVADPRSAAGTVQLGADAGDLEGSGKQTGTQLILQSVRRLRLRRSV
jgi:hypothetical protein